jgi:hypothetical protein
MAVTVYDFNDRKYARVFLDCLLMAIHRNKLVVLQGRSAKSYCIGCPTTNQTRHFFNNSKTNEDIATKQTHTTDTFLFISHTTNVLLFKSRCNIFIGFRIIKEMPGLVGSGTPRTTQRSRPVHLHTHAHARDFFYVVESFFFLMSSVACERSCVNATWTYAVRVRVSACYRREFLKLLEPRNGGRPLQSLWLNSKMLHNP